MVLDNFRNRVTSLITEIRDNLEARIINIESYEYRVDSLRDALTFRDLPNEVAVGLVLASQIISSSLADRVSESEPSGYQVPQACDTGGRP